MIDLSKIDELANRLTDSLPPGARQMRDEVQAQFKAVLSKSLEAMDLVTREEFDIQAAALKRANEKLKSLEERLDELTG